MAFLSGLMTPKGLALCGAAAAGVYALRRWFAGGVCRYDASNTDLSGKTVLITGANTGIGLESAVLLARMGAHVVMACRDDARGTKALADARARAGGHGRLELMQCDLADQNSVRRFAAEFKAKHSQLHVLMNNAGVMMCPFWRTAQGLELQFGTNHIGHFLLTTLLLDTLKASAPSRVVNFSSNAHRRGTIDLTDLQWQKRAYTPAAAYSASKIANILFTTELARRLDGTGVTAYALHPGVVRTDLWRHLDWKVRALSVPLSPLLALATKDSVAGAQTQVWCSVARELDGGNGNGRYFADCALKPVTHAQASDPALAAQLWTLSEQLCAPTNAAAPAAGAGVGAAK